MPAGQVQPSTVGAGGVSSTCTSAGVCSRPGTAGALRDQVGETVNLSLRDRDEVVYVERGDTSDRSFGLALDVGTTTVVGHVVDLTSGTTYRVYTGGTSTGVEQEPEAEPDEAWLDRIPTPYDWQNKKKIEVDYDELIFQASEYVKDGLIAIVEVTGKDEWFERMLAIEAGDVPTGPPSPSRPDRPVREGLHEAVAVALRAVRR